MWTKHDREAWSAFVSNAAKGTPVADKSGRKPRARPTQWEDAEADALAVQVATRWYWPGFVRWEHRSASASETFKRSRQGAGKGWPDFGLFVPGHSGYGHWVPAGPETIIRVRAVLELKREELRPARPTVNWWLEPFDGKTKHGLTQDQARWLRILDGCGFDTFVAYGWNQALKWLDEVAGPRPAVLPEGW